MHILINPMFKLLSAEKYFEDFFDALLKIHSADPFATT
jgi:hypothetical protein